MRYELADTVLDTDARELVRGGERVHLSPKAYELLELLVAARPRAMSKQEIYDKLWPDTFVVEANLPVLIREIRSAIGDDAHEVIRTVQRFGYSLGEVGEDPLTHALVFGKRQHVLHRGENVIGRETFGATTVSRRHAIITIAGDAATLTDLNSKNGTWVNGKKLKGSTPLHDGAIVRFGSIETTYRRTSGESSTDTFLG